MIERKEHNGVVYDKYNTHKKVRGQINVNETRIRLEGELKVCRTKGSYKYGDEIQFYIVSSKSLKPEVTQRNASEWNTMEMFFPISEIDNIIEFLKNTKKSLS